MEPRQRDALIARWILRVAATLISIGLLFYDRQCRIKEWGFQCYSWNYTSPLEIFGLAVIVLGLVFVIERLRLPSR